MKHKNKFHIDYITESNQIIHDDNKYDSLIEAIEMLNKQLIGTIEKHSVKKIIIQTWGEAAKNAKQHINISKTRDRSLL